VYTKHKQHNTLQKKRANEKENPYTVGYNILKANSLNSPYQQHKHWTNASELSAIASHLSIGHWKGSFINHASDHTNPSRWFHEMLYNIG